MPKKKGGKNNVKPVAENFRIAVNWSIKNFLGTDSKELEFPTSLFSEERAYVHVLAKEFGLKSKSRGKGLNRYVTVYKREGSTIVQADAVLALTGTTHHTICNLLTDYPLTNKERQDLLPVTERDRTFIPEAVSLRDSAKLSNTRPGFNGPIIPPVSVNPEFLPYRQSLPIWQMRDTIMQAINANQVVIISGETGCGKTTQVPQFIMDHTEKTGRGCRILCSQPRRISAVTIAERVALERDEICGNTVGYQIRLESKTSYRTCCTYCTYGVLLRMLLAGDSVLTSVTHIIVDEVHERDRFSDFVLIVLRDAISRYRSIKLILMSATLDTANFAKYFNNCPVITVPGRLYEVQEYFLEDILKRTGYMTKEMVKVKKQLEEKGKHVAELEKWTAALTLNGTQNEKTGDKKMLTNTSSGQHPEGKGKLESWLADEMDKFIADAFMTGSENSFTQILHLVMSENVSADYQHSQTGLTTLMAAVVRGYFDLSEQLLNLGASVTTRCSNEMSAVDWAVKENRTDILELLYSYMPSETESNTKVENLEEMSEEAKQLVDIYYHCVADEQMDYDLMVTVLLDIHRSGRKGAVLVFLPGYDEIVTLRERIFANDKKFFDHGKLMVLTLHSKMQTVDQRKIFRPAPSGVRKIILSTNIAETSITIDDVVFVVDAGKVKEKSYNAISGVCMLRSTWISKACVRQRRGRAGRKQPGICFHLFSSARYKAMEEYQTPEILRTPLQELCLQTKLLAPPNTPIADYLTRAIQPPTFVVIRNAVQLLKQMDALDAWEDLTDLGRHLVEITIEPRFGKMIIFSIFLKCLDPVLTIVCCLSYGDPYVLPAEPEQKRIAAMVHKRCAAGTFSDHMALLRLFQGWQAARHNNTERQYSERHFINSGSMELITGMRTHILSQLRTVGLVKARGAGDIRDVNSNADNWALVKAALTGGAYPNLARVDREHNTLRTQKEFKVLFHPSSTLHETGKNARTSSSYAAAVAALPSDWLLYEEMNRVGRVCRIQTCTVVSPLTVAIFAGPSRLPLDAVLDNDPVLEEIDSDSDEETVPEGKTAMLKLDDWLTFRADPESAQLALHLRFKWYTLLLKRLRTPSKPWTQADESVIKALVATLTAEEQVLGLELPSGVGQRPWLLQVDCYPNANSRKQTVWDSSSSCHEDNTFLTTIENLGTRYHNNQMFLPENSPTKSISDQDRAEGGSMKSYSSGTPSPTPAASQGVSTDSVHNSDSPSRYFVIKAGSLKAIEASMSRGAWAFTANTERKLLRAFKEGKNVYVIFGLQGSGHFQGYARLIGDKPEVCDNYPELSGPNLNAPLPIEWIKRTNIPYPATRHLLNPYNENHKVQTSRDGQEIEPSVGEALCKLWDKSPAWNNRNAMNPLQQSQNSSFHGRPIRGRFHYNSHYNSHHRK